VTNLASNLTETTRAHGDRIAVRVDDAVMTYRELDEASARVAGLLHERGLKPGDRVGIMMPNVAEVPVVYYGVLRAGGIVVPMNPLLKAREVAYYLTDSGARLIFAWHTFAGEAQGGAEQVNSQVVVVEPGAWGGLLASADPDNRVVGRDDGDTAVILYTSGTTGHPKGAELTHGNLARNTEVMTTDLIELTPDDVIFGGLPLFHAFGQTCTLNAAVAVGASLSPTGPATTSPPSGSASRAARRSPWRCCVASRRRSALLYSRGTACPRPHRWPRSTTRTARASRARSARRSVGCRCAWWTRTAGRSRRVRRARSSSVATT